MYAESTSRVKGLLKDNAEAVITAHKVEFFTELVDVSGGKADKRIHP